MEIKRALKQIGPVVEGYSKYKDLKVDYRRRQNLSGRYTFINRSKGQKRLCIVLAGFKEFLYADTMSRLQRFVPEDVDVCLLSAGKYSSVLEELARKNDWSYLYTKDKNVSLIQNIAIDVHKAAEFIYKIDEDIFVTENFFKNVVATYEYCNNYSEFDVGFCAPLIPINGFGHVRILDILGMTETYTERFERPKIRTGRDRLIESSPQAAIFMWNGLEIPGTDEEAKQSLSIDALDAYLSKMDFSYSVCPVRFSIGAIYFSRQLWNDMDYFYVKSRGTPDLGQDEVQICRFCYMNNRALIISENTAVGHLGFGSQNDVMRDWFLTNQ